METIDRIDRNRLATIVLGILAIAAIVLLTQFLRSQPQFGADEEVFKTVDALFTALTSRDNQRLSDCEQRLQTYRAAGTLPSSAAKKLDGIVKQARSGEWEASARKLYDFMLAQRRMP